MGWRELSLRHKILTVILVSTVAALQFCAFVLLAFQWRWERQSLRAELEVQADLVGAEIGSLIVAGSPRAVQRTLAALEADARVVWARVEDREQRELANWSREGDPPRGVEETGARTEGLRVTRPLLHGGVSVGRIVMAGSLDQVNRALSRSALTVFSALAVCTLLTFYLSRRWTRILAQPIFNLSEMAKAVSESRDYSLRAEQTSNDELGDLTLAFNDMLAQIQSRDEELLRTHGELELRIEESERSQRRERELSDRLTRSEKMESLGILAGGVAHDLNNILGPMVGYPDLLMDGLDADDPMRRQLGLIQESAMRAAAIIQDLLTLARRGNYTAVPIDLGALTRGIFDSEELQAQLRQHAAIEIRLDLDDTTFPVTGSGSHLTQVVMNLVLNAFEAMPSGGVLGVSLHEVTLDLESAAYEKIPAGRYTVLSVSDTGRGIPSGDRDRVFEPFYSKKKMGRSGSGLGLAVVWGVVKDLGGYLDVHSEEGLGTTFSLYFPTTRRALDSRTDEIHLHGDETVLVVDDEPLQRDLAQRVLESLGYRVALCESGRQAVAYLQLHDVDLVILDMTMEEDFDGLTTFRHILRYRPSQRCIIASGYSEGSRVKEALEIGAGAFVAKPYTRESMGSAVRRALDAVPGPTIV